MTISSPVYPTYDTHHPTTVPPPRHHQLRGERRAAWLAQGARGDAAHLHRAACLAENVYLYNGVMHVVGDDADSVSDTVSLLERGAGDGANGVVALTPVELAANLTEAGDSVWESDPLRGGGGGGGTRGGGSDVVVLWPLEHQFVSGHRTGFGHMLHDAILPIFWAMGLLGATTSNSQVLVLHSDAVGGLQPLHAYFELLSSRAPAYVDDLPCDVCPPDHWCRMGNVLTPVNWHLLGLYDTFYTSAAETKARGDMYRAFSASALHNLGLPPTNRRQRRHHRVVLIQRQHSRVVLNMVEIEAAIRAAWADQFGLAGLAAPALTVVTSVMDGMSMRDQVLLIHEATAVVAMEGGALDNILHAPEGLAAVVLGRDPTVPFPDGCYVNETLSLDPFTHRRFFEALSPTMCTGFVHAKGAAGGAGYTAEPGLVASVLMGLLGDERCALEGKLSVATRACMELRALSRGAHNAVRGGISMCPVRGRDT